MTKAERIWLAQEVLRYVGRFIPGNLQKGINLFRDLEAKGKIIEARIALKKQAQRIRFGRNAMVNIIKNPEVLNELFYRYDYSLQDLRSDVNPIIELVDEIINNSEKMTLEKIKIMDSLFTNIIVFNNNKKIEI